MKSLDIPLVPVVLYVCVGGGEGVVANLELNVSHKEDPKALFGRLKSLQQRLEEFSSEPSDLSLSQ